MKRSTNRYGGIVCSGCPIYPHIPDEQFRFPSCELCHWPAIGVGSTHIWRCAYCRHWNEHGLLRPRVSAVLLRLADVDPAARQLDVVDARYGRYLIPRTRPAPCRPTTPQHTGIAAYDAAAGWAGAPGRHRLTALERARWPVYARATVAGLPVLIVGGDRSYAHPLGLAELDPEPCSFGSRATRIACPCDQASPCPHGQALYAHVVSRVKPGLASPATSTVATVSARTGEAWSEPPGR
jgi:hypothetical protein